MEPRPRYALLEIERRWLVHPGDIGNFDRQTCWVIKDTYLSETRLRLRSIEDPQGNVVYKLGKKYGKISGIAEPITTLYLTEKEYDVFAGLGGRKTVKRRYQVEGGSLDCYEAPEFKDMIFELEFPDEESARKYVPPSFVAEEITGQARYTGYAIAWGGEV